MKASPSREELRLLGVLNLYSVPIARSVLSVLITTPDNENERLVESLIRRGWLTQNDGFLSLTDGIPKSVVRALEGVSSRDWLDDLVERLQRLVESKKVGADYLIIPLKKAGQEKQAATVAYDCARQEIEKRNFPAALCRCRDALSVPTGKPGDEEADRLLVKATLTFSDLCHRLRRDYTEVRNALGIGMDAALRLGDQRHVALLNLHLGRAYGMTHRAKEAVERYSLGLDLVEKIGDRDITMRSADFYGHFYFLRGLCKEVVNSCETALSMGALGNDHVPDVLTSIHLALGSIAMGQSHRAIGVMDSSWRRALLGADYSLAAYYRAFLGQMLILCGRIEEGASHLQAAEKEASGYDDPYTGIWVKRTFAYYHYLKGEPREAYRLLEETLALSRTLGIPRPLYALPWILELLSFLQKEGYPPLPDYEYSKELQFAMDGPNALLRGAALRLLADEPRYREEHPEEAEGLLAESELELTRSGATVELAKTRADMARLKLRRGDQKAARDLSLKAWEGWSSLGQSSFPSELKPLIDSGESLETPEPMNKEIFSRYLEMLDGIPPTADLNEMRMRLIHATCQFFEAERGGLFSYRRGTENQGLGLESGYNLTAEQVKSEEFRNNLVTIARAYEGNEPLTMRIPKSTGGSTGRQIGAILCLPIELVGQRRGVLYYDKSYLGGTFDLYSKTVTTQIARSLGKYVDRIYNYSRQTEVKSREALNGMTLEGQPGIEVRDGFGSVFQDLMERAEMVAKSDAPVLILGETGVGKEVLARMMHLKSSRRRGPFIPINPSCIPESLVESELFGYEKGAFTGADRGKPGRMELAHRGTLFIDEVGEIPKFIQVKLLRALEERSLVRVGGMLKREVDFRLITATNRDLVKEVESGNFRQDLYYRLGVVTLRVPGLRERGDDVLRLAQEFLSYYAKRYNRPVHLLSAEEKQMLKAYHWPGNVRELRNVVEQSVILSAQGRLDLTIPRAPRLSVDLGTTADSLFLDKPTMDDMQRRYIKYVLGETNGKIGGERGAAKVLGLKRTTLYKRMKRLGLT
ncbi:MAG: sigma 54-interacting transcriptional regulator [Thermodesulfobacteriota bacterium]